jgi:hypothetical protein
MQSHPLYFLPYALSPDYFPYIAGREIKKKDVNLREGEAI